MKKIKKKIKHTRPIEFIYNLLLNYKCKSVQTYFFVATAGRSGSNSLSKIFQAIDKTIALHEPYPIMYNDYPKGTNRELYFDELFRKLKRFYIKRAAVYKSYYLETNHQFLKNFINPAIKHFKKKIKIIHLVRDPVSVASSFYRIDSIPGMTERGRYYLIDPKENDNIIQIADLLYYKKEFEHDLYKCLWYWYEVEARVKEAKKMYPNITFYKLRTEDLNSEKQLLKMFNKLDVPVNIQKLKSLVGTRSNIRKHEKKRNVKPNLCIDMKDKLEKKIVERYGKNLWI